MPQGQALCSRMMCLFLCRNGVVHRQCRLIWLILHQGVRYEERGPAVTTQSKQRRTAEGVQLLNAIQDVYLSERWAFAASGASVA
jgi:hypothetical protein